MTKKKNKLSTIVAAADVIVVGRAQAISPGFQQTWWSAQIFGEYFAEAY